MPDDDSVDDIDRPLPMQTAIALCRAHLQRQLGELADAQMLDAFAIELAAHEDLTLVIEAQALLGAAIARQIEGLAEALEVPGITAKSILLGFERTWQI